MKRGKQNRSKKSSPKHGLSLPDLDQARSAVLNSLPSKESQRGYLHAIDEFITWDCSEPRLRTAQPGPRCWYPAGQRAEEPRRSSGQLAHCRPGKSALAGA